MIAAVAHAGSDEAAEESAGNPGAWDDDLAGDPDSGTLPDIVELRPEEAVRPPPVLPSDCLTPLAAKH